MPQSWRPTDPRGTMASSNHLIFLGFMAAGALAGCAASKPAEAPDQVRKRPEAEAIRGQQQPGETVTELDANGDGRTDVWEYRVKDVLVRKELDLNWDGRVDVTQYLDPQGAKVREVMDLDYDGKVDATYFYAEGKRTKGERDLDGDGRMDSWLYYENDTLVRKERDANHDGRVDYWEYWENGQVARIGEDLDGDGTVDQWTRNPGAAAKSKE